MGLFEKLFGKENKMPKIDGYWKTLTAYQPSFTNWQGSIYESELVRSAINSRATHCSKLQVEIKGGKPYFNTRANKQPNELMTWSQFLARVSTILDMQNNAFIVPMTDKTGTMTGYYPVLPSRCDVVEANGEPWLRYHFNNRTAVIELARVGLMKKFQYKDDLFGETNNALNSTVKLLDLQRQGIEEAIKAGATFRFMAQLNNFSKAEDVKEQQERFTKDNMGSDAGGLLLFPNTFANIKQIESKPYNVDFKQMEFIKDNVFNYFGVNDDIVKNKAYGDSWSAFYEGAIEPFAIQLSEVLTKMTFTQNEISHGANVMVTANRLQFMTTQEKKEVTSDLFDRGILSTNQVLDIWNLPHVEGGDERAIRGEYVNAYEKISKVSEDTEDDRKDDE